MTTPRFIKTDGSELPISVAMGSLIKDICEEVPAEDQDASTVLAYIEFCMRYGSPVWEAAATMFDTICKELSFKNDAADELTGIAFGAMLRGEDGEDALRRATEKAREAAAPLAEASVNATRDYHDIVLSEMEAFRATGAYLHTRRQRESIPTDKRPFADNVKDALRKARELESRIF